MERSWAEIAAGNDQQHQPQPHSAIASTMKQQPQHQAEVQVIHPPQQQRCTSPFPPLNLSGTTAVFEWAAPHEPNPFRSAHHQNIMMDQSSNIRNFQENAVTPGTPNSSAFDMTPSRYLSLDKDPALMNGTLTHNSSPTHHIPQHHPHHQHPSSSMEECQSLLFLQTAAEQETLNKAIERENALMHQRLVEMAKKKSDTTLDQEIEEARLQLRRQSLEEQERKRQALAKENETMQLKLAQLQWRSPEKPKLAPAVEQRMEELEEERRKKLEEQTRRNEQVAKENTRLKLKLAQVQWRETTYLDPAVEQRRQELKEERRKSLEEQKLKKQLLAKENARLKQRLSQVRGKVVKQLDPMVEQRRLDLVEERRKSLEQLKEAQAKQVELSMSCPRTKTRVKTPTNTALDSSIEQRRHDLEQDRRQKAERKRQELRAHTKAMKERLCSVKGREQRSLDKATKSKRQELQEKRAHEKFQQEQELKKQNAAIRKRMSKFLESDEYYDNSPVATSTRFSFEIDEQRQLQKKRQQEKLERKREELETHRREFLKRTRGVKRGRTSLSLDAEVEALRKDLAEKSISDQQERIQKIRKQNVELKQRLSDISGKETKSLSGVVQALRSEREQARKEAVLQRHRELMEHQKAYKKRLSDVTSKDSTKLKESTQSIRSQRNAKRNTAIRQKQKELARHKAKLNYMVQNVKSPIQQMLTNSSPPFMVTPSPVSFITIDTKTNTSLQSPKQVQMFDFQSIVSPHGLTTPESLLEAAKEASSSWEKKRLGPKRIVEACERNQQLRDQNVKLRKRLAEATAASIQQLEATITP